MNINACILFISDDQAPHEHQDELAFLKALKNKFKPTRVIHIGDEADNTASAVGYDVNPDLDSAGPELLKTREKLRKLYKLFPKVDVMISNHLLRIFKKFKKAGLSKLFMADLHKIYKLPKTWKYHNKLVLNLPNTGPCLIQHGHQGDAMKYSRSHGISVVSGHLHSKAYIQYWKDSLRKLRFAAQIGCMIKNKSEAFDYNKDDELYPIYSTLVIKNGYPIIVIMEVDKNDRWTGELRY